MCVKQTRLKVGDRVRIRDDANNIISDPGDEFVFTASMEYYLGKETKIQQIIGVTGRRPVYFLEIDRGANYWAEAWVEGVIIDEKRTRFEQMSFLMQ